MSNLVVGSRNSTTSHLFSLLLLLFLDMMFSRVSRSSAFQLAIRRVNQNHHSFGVKPWSATSTARHVSFQPSSPTHIGQLKTTFDLPDPSEAELPRHHQLTKIVATIGPTSEQLEPLGRVVKAGMKIMRLNFSHATKEEVELRMKNFAINQVSFLF